MTSTMTTDQRVTEWVVERRTASADAIAHTVTLLGNTAVLAAVMVVVAFILIRAGARAEAIALVAGSVLGYLAMVTIKHAVARHRPPVDGRLLDIHTYSFPSGHAMMSMIVYGLVAVVAHRTSAWVGRHSWVVIAAPILSIAIGLTRIYLGVHWTTDVICGWLIGAAWVAAVALLLRWWAPTEREHIPHRDHHIEQKEHP